MTDIPYMKRDLMILREWAHEMRWRPDPLLARPISEKDWRRLNEGVKPSKQMARTGG